MNNIRHTDSDTPHPLAFRDRILASKINSKHIHWEGALKQGINVVPPLGSDRVEYACKQLMTSSFRWVCIDIPELYSNDIDQGILSNAVKQGKAIYDPRNKIVLNCQLHLCEGVDILISDAVTLFTILNCIKYTPLLLEATTKRLFNFNLILEYTYNKATRVVTVSFPRSNTTIEMVGESVDQITEFLDDFFVEESDGPKAN